VYQAMPSTPELCTEALTAESWAASDAGGAAEAAPAMVDAATTPTAMVRNRAVLMALTVPPRE
jgi:hypothetical protein